MCDEKELWQPIREKYLSKYQISDIGNVRNAQHVYVKPTISRGYFKVVLNNDTSTGNRKKCGYYVHELVAKTYIDNPFNSKEIIHMDGNLLNNSVDNLKWNDKFAGEEWKPFPYKGYSNYEVSNYGRVKNKHQMLTFQIHGGYYRTSIFTDDKVQKYHQVHMLVAEAFIENPSEHKFVMHINHNLLNNYADNLKWGIKNDGKYANETWKIISIPELENNYEISDMGRYRNRNTGKLLEAYKCNSYLMASLYTKNSLVRQLVHRLVAKEFVKNSNPNEFDIVNHIDGNKFNNRASNLEWTNASGNAKHSFKELGKKAKGKSVIRIDNTGSKVIYDSIVNAARMNNIAIHNLKKCLRGDQSSHMGFKWEYLNNIPIVFDISQYDEIKNYPNYFISKDGRIYSNKSKKFLSIQQSDYPYVNLTEDSKTYHLYIHRLVAIQFIPNPKNSKVVNHIDGNKDNYHYLNLEWVSHKENSKHYNSMKNKGIVLRELLKGVPGNGENSLLSKSIPRDNPAPSS
jgi:hypothetical protein